MSDQPNVIFDSSELIGAIVKVMAERTQEAVVEQVAIIKGALDTQKNSFLEHTAKLCEGFNAAYWMAGRAKNGRKIELRDALIREEAAQQIAACLRAEKVQQTTTNTRHAGKPIPHVLLSRLSRLDCQHKYDGVGRVLRCGMSEIAPVHNSRNRAYYSHEFVPKHTEEEIAQEHVCQAQCGADDICGLPETARCHNIAFSFGHTFIPESDMDPQAR